ncbi:hypothetical protein GQ457_09G017900 [Hibiscus cannabinus]
MPVLLGFWLCASVSPYGPKHPLGITSCKYSEISTRRGLSFRRRDRPVRYSVFKHSPTSVHHHVPVDMSMSVDHIDLCYRSCVNSCSVDSVDSVNHVTSIDQSSFVDPMILVDLPILVDSSVPRGPLVLTDLLSDHGYGLVTLARRAMIVSSEPAMRVDDQTLTDDPCIRFNM